MSHSIITCSVWLGQFLQRRGLSKPDQRGLYTYHCSFEEYVDLRRILREFRGFSVGSNDAASSACFVLFGSEWYRREYRSEHAWSWEPIWKELGFSLSPVDLSSAIPKGLEGYWKRPLHLYDAGHRNFLGSVFSEGGLPFQVLRESGSRFQTLFDRLLRQHDQWKLMGFSTVQQVEQYLQRINLPQAFSSHTSVELIASMVDQLVSLVRDYGLTEEDEPVTRLDIVNPKWRELFPLPLDNETGSDLLNSLLKTATSEDKKRRKSVSGWGCQHFWHETQPNALKVQVTMPEEVVFTLTMKPSTTRFELAVVEDGRVIAELGPGYALVNDNVARIQMRQREVIGTRHNYNAQLSLVARAGGMLIAKLPIENSIVALGEVPLGFELENDRWQLCGQASFNTSSEELMLLLPSDYSVTIIEKSDDAIISDISAVFSLPVVRVKGKVQLQVESDDVYRIRTGDSISAGLGLELVGDEIDWETKPALTFIGLPRVRWPVGSGDLRQLGGDLYIAGKQPGDGVLQEFLGAQFVSVRNRRGDALLRRKVGVLPPDFRVEIRGGDNPGQGSVLIYSQQSCLFQMKGDALQVQQIRHEDHVELSVLAKDLPPIRVSLLVTPSLFSDPIEIDLPFPGSGCMGFDANGNQLRRDLSVDELPGVRLYLFGMPSVPTRFTIELTLMGNTARNACYTWSYLAADKPLEISLFNIREQIIDLLSLQSGIDQVVELRVSGSGKDTLYRIRKYAAEVQLDCNRSLLSVVSLHGSAAADMPMPVLMLLHDPMRAPVALPSRTSEGVLTGEYDLPRIFEKDGPWLVLPQVDSSLSFRPMFIPGSWEKVVQTEGIQSLQKAVIAFDHNEPISSFTSVLDAMAINPMHSGWQFLRSIFDGYGYLPLATFEVWKAVIKNTRVLSMALFKFEMSASFLGRLEAEFPVFWEFFPISEIHLAAKRYLAFLMVQGVEKKAADGLIERMFKRLGEVFPAHGQSVQRFLSNKPVGPEINMPLVLFKSVLHTWYHELIRERSEAVWPEYGWQQLERWHNQNTVSVIDFRSDVNHRKAVLYLPVFAAAVASGKVQFEDVFENDVEAVFFLRQVRDFDSKWFNSIYQYCLLNSVVDEHKAELANE